jgi:hypothetical protein
MHTEIIKIPKGQSLIRSDEIIDDQAVTLARCTCPECETLDRLPARRQGIPGAFQTTFDAPAPDPADEALYETELAYLTARLIAKYGTADARDIAMIWMGKSQASADSLPLFIGALEPTLF